MMFKLGMYQLGLTLYKVYINDDPGFLWPILGKSNWVACTFECGKLLQSHLMKEILQQRIILTE